MMDLNKSQEELVKMLQNMHPDSTEYKLTSFEIQRIQQDTNNVQIANLTDLIRQYIHTATKSSKNDRNLSRVAIVIATISLTIQLLSVVINS
jgi:hypothetical protein